jgi:hypothetical protein
MSSTTELLDRMLEPVSEAISPEIARKLISLRADDVAQARMDKLADARNEGSLTPQEDAEYRALIAAASVIAVLQSKARAVLARTSAA